MSSLPVRIGTEYSGTGSDPNKSYSGSNGARGHKDEMVRAWNG